FCFTGEISLYCDPSSCVDNTYFDAYLLQCTDCDKSKNLEPTEDRLSCTCNAQSKILNLDGGQFPECEPCPESEMPTTDKLNCLPCSTRIKKDNDTAVCTKCGSQEITVERDYNGTLKDAIKCQNCTLGSIPSSDGRFCVPCLISNCSCPGTHELLEGWCVPINELSNWPDDRNSYVIEFETGEKIDSYFIRRYLRISVYLCKVGNNISIVAYFVYDIVKKYFYNKMLNLTVVSFAPDGHFKKISSATGSFLQLCPGSWTSLNSGLRFGSRYHHSCTLPASQLVQLRDTEFLDLYVQYWEGGESRLYAVPVLALDLKVGGRSTNKDSDRSQWQLTRRFFLIDKIGGVKSATDKSKGKVEDVPYVIRYLKSCTLRVKIQEREEEGRIYPPLLVLKYGEITQEDIESDTHVSLTFSVEYEMDNSLSHAIEVSMGVLSALAVVWSGIETWSCSRRSGRVGIDLVTLGQLIVFSCGNLANVFFFVVVCASIHTFTFYKGQSVIQILLPAQKQDDLVKSYIISAFSLKIVEVIHLIWRQISIDIFFIDWERPRARSSVIRPRSQLNASDTSEQPISIWRTYFVANEWNEIQTTRKVSLMFQLVVTVFILKVLGVENWAVADPELHTTQPEYMKNSSPSLICQFAVGVMVYLLVYFLQWTFMVSIYERYIKNVIHEFVDICSMANISVFILALENYGFYIHGRSAHGFADTDMQTMLGQLQREEEDLCGHRGLLPGSDQQTFQMAIPLQLRSYYRKVMAPINSVMLPTKRLSMAGAGGLRTKVMSGNMDRSIQAYHNMNKFLAAFLEHALKDLDYDVREKMFVESLLDIEFTEVFDKGILYSDNGHSFDNVLFYGNECTLATFDIFLFSFVAVLFHDFLLAAIVTAFFAKILVIIRRVGGRNNLAKKTLIDERFLV
ncbi:hypothetical protein ANN_10160, partial [Periplaneta americana]